MNAEQYPVSEILHHLGERDFPSNAVAPPIFQTSIFCFKSFEDFQAALADEAHKFIYSRGNNPTVNLCERKLAALEHAERAKLVGSGVAAISCAILAQVKSGDHCVVVDNSYSWTRYMFNEYLPRFGVTATFELLEIDRLTPYQLSFLLFFLITGKPLHHDYNLQLFLHIFLNGMDLSY